MGFLLKRHSSIQRKMMNSRPGNILVKRELNKLKMIQRNAYSCDKIVKLISQRIRNLKKKKKKIRMAKKKMLPGKIKRISNILE